MIYKYRWTIEIFFRFFKHVPGCRHLLSQDRNGIELQVYFAIIACMLISLWTGRKPTLRYIESNPLRAKMVKNSRDWEYSSLAIRSGADKKGLKISRGPVKLPDRWNRLVNVLPGESVDDAIDNCFKRGRPYGNVKWIETITQKLGLEITLRPRGRPKKGT